MEDQRLGTSLRMLRIRRGWRQADLALVARVSPSTVSRLERGQLGSMRVDSVRGVAASLEVQIELRPRWRGGELARLHDQAHAALGEGVTRELAARGWAVRPEVSFSRYGERGSVDLLAWHEPTATILVVELKTVLVDMQDLVMTADRKTRLASAIGQTVGWAPRNVGSLVVVADTRTSHRRVAEHRALLRAAFPDDGRVARGWLRQPRGTLRALTFRPISRGRNARTPLAGVQRVRRSRVSASERG